MWRRKKLFRFFDFRNMFLNMQFVPEYSNPLYLDELFEDDYRTNKKKLNNNNDLIISVKNDLNREERETENVGIHEE